MCKARYCRKEGNGQNLRLYFDCHWHNRQPRRHFLTVKHGANVIVHKTSFNELTMLCKINDAKRPYCVFVAAQMAMTCSEQQNLPMFQLKLVGLPLNLQWLNISVWFGCYKNGMLGF